MNTIENNKLIAEFMGLTLSDGDWIGEDFIGHEPTGSMLTRNLRFHTSWDWLMPVVDKIEHTSAYVNIKGCHVKISTWVDVNALTKLEAVYKAVVEFIKWYNENK